MPSFSTRDTELLEEYFHGMTGEMAGLIWQHAKVTGQTYAALYYKVNRNGKVRPASMTIVLTVDKDTLNDPDTWARVVTGEYHPRKDGKADMVFHTEWVYHDND